MRKILKTVKRIIVSLSVIPLSFVKIFHEVGVLPSLDGPPVKSHYYYSVFDNLETYNVGFLVFVLMGVSLLSAILILHNTWTERKVVRITANLFYFVTVFFFVVLLTAASTVARLY